MRKTLEENIGSRPASAPRRDMSTAPDPEVIKAALAKRMEKQKKLHYTETKSLGF